MSDTAPMNKPQWQIDIEERREKARTLVRCLCAGSVRWSLSIPAEPDDPDLVLAASLDDIPHLLAALDKMREALEDILPWAEQAIGEEEVIEDNVKWQTAQNALNFDPTKQEATQNDVY